MDPLQLIGRFHPLVLHLPIGFLVLAFLMECVHRKSKNTSFRPAIHFALKWGMWSAIIAAASGYLLSWEGGYEEQLLQKHQWLGVATVFFSIFTYRTYSLEEGGEKNKMAFPLFCGLMILLGATGHFGGSITHGSDFLLTPFVEKKINTARPSLDSALVFQDVVRPILEKKCNSCHKSSKKKGELVMSTIEGIQRGGKSGAVFVKGDAEASLLMQRIHLPEEAEEHMPPRGKVQLSKREAALLGWWIEQGASFNQRVNDLERSEQIQQILDVRFAPEDPLLSKKVAMPSAAKVQALEAAGGRVQQLVKGQPYLNVDLSGRTNLSAGIMKQVKQLSEQIISLNLANTNLNDELLSSLGKLPHLRKLSIQKTAVTSEGLRVLQNLEFLESLNLYETKIDDQSLPILASLNRLKRLYIWQTPITSKAIAQLKQERTSLEVNTGVDPGIFGKAHLKAPSIIASRDVFEDTLQVAFSTNLSNTQLFYTLDGSFPDTNALRYQQPFIIDQTRNVRVIAMKEGWENSEPMQRTFAQLKYKPVKVSLNKKPNPRYPGNGEESLIDGHRGTAAYTDTSWLGFQGEHFTVTFDLGEAHEVSTVNLSAMEDVGAWIFFPKGAKVELSENGKTFKAVYHQSFPVTTEPKPAERNLFSINFTTQVARYVRVNVESNLVNPQWHPNPGGQCWVFVDEILIE